MNSFTNCIPFFIAIPLAGAFLTAIMGNRMKRLPELSAVICSAALLVFSILSIKVARDSGAIVYSVGAWKPPMGIALVLDGFSAFMLVTVNLVAFLISVYAIPYMDRYTGRWQFYSLFLLMLGGMNGVLITGDIFNLYVFLEIASLASFALVAFSTERHSLEAAFKYAVMSTLGSLFVLLGIVFLYSYTSTLNMADIASVLLQKRASYIMGMVTVLFIMGFGLKAALVPFHAWLPDAHPAAPAPISAMLSGVLIKSLGVYTLCRLFFNVLGVTPALTAVLMFLGVLSMVVGGFMMLGQTDIKRLLACSSVSQMGYIFLGMGIGTPIAVLGALLHLFNHSIFKSLLFLNSGAVEYSTGTRDLKELGGLMTKMPVTGTTNLIGAMAISGIPPFSGFWSKLLIILGAFLAGKYVYAALAVFASLLTFGALMKVMKGAFFGTLRESLRSIQEVPGLMRFSMVVLALICIGGGCLILPGIRDAFLNQAVSVITDGMQYTYVVMRGI